MLQVARLSPNVLGEAAEQVRSFVQSKINSDGGWQDRQGSSDLYYSVFGMACLTALQTNFDAAVHIPFHQQYGTGDGLDFVHLTSLIRCRAYTNDLWNPDDTAKVTQNLEAFRSQDGGFGTTPNAQFGSAYGCFLAMGAYQDLKLEVPNHEGIIRCLDSLKTQDDAYSNLPGQAEGTTTATAAAVAVLRTLEHPISAQTGHWLLTRCHTDGGFFAMPRAPMPDLLSTATALHALERMHVPTETIKEQCLDFVDTLWCADGGFYGHWADDMLDCEYTYYGLLSLGHLSL